jgi:hypothetical protein
MAMTVLTRLSELKVSLGVSRWELRTPPFIPGYAPPATLPALDGLTLERTRLLPARMPGATTWNTWAARTYVYREESTGASVQLTIVVDRESAAGAIDGLLLHLLQSQRKRKFVRGATTEIGDVAIAEPDKNARHFLRRNVGVSVVDYGEAGELVPRLARAVDTSLRERANVDSLAADPTKPKIVRFAADGSAVEVGGQVAIRLEVDDRHPPLDTSFLAEGGSANTANVPQLQWYFRAGPKPGKGRASVLVINAVNLSASAAFDIDITPIRRGAGSERLR